METPTADELLLIRELVSEGYLSAEQVKQILTQWRKFSRTEAPIGIATIISKSGFLKPEILNKYNKSHFADSANSTFEKHLHQNEFIEDLSKTKEIFDHIDNVESQKLLGLGIIGKSYLVEMKGLDSKVVKLINPKLLDNKSYMNSVKKGLEVIDYQNHPFLIPHQFKETNNQKPYFTSNYIVNESIGAFVKATGRLEINSGLEIIRKTCDILKFFERIKRPHLGLHPENIFREPNGNIYLKDFEWNRNFFALMEDRIAFGPGVCFMSPEYIKGKNVNHTSDIYSLGILLYYLLSRRVPFHGNIETQLTKKERLDYHDISEIHKNIPIYIGDLIKKMIEPNQADRYQSFESLIVDLDEILKKRYLNDASTRKPSYLREVINSNDSNLKLSASDFDHPIKATNSPKAGHNFFKSIKKIMIYLIMGSCVYFLSRLALNIPFDKQKNPPEKVQTSITDLSKNKTKITPKIDNNIVIEEDPSLLVETKKIDKGVEIQDKIKNEFLKKIDVNNDTYKFSKKLNAIKIIQENLKEDTSLSRDVVNRMVAEELAKIDKERQIYWEDKKEKLKKNFSEKNETKTKELIEEIKKETENDEEIQNKIFHLRVETLRLEPEDSRVFDLDNDSLILKDSVANKSTPLLENHDYAGLVEVLSNAIKNEKNKDQKQVYSEQLEFYEHADKIKKISQNITVKSNVLLRSLYLDEDGSLEAVSSKGFHVKSTNNKIIPWKNVSAKALSALAARYEPSSLGECISLLIYASRASNHIAMQKALRTIDLKYGAATNSPLIKESQEKLKEMKDYLEDDTIKWQLSLIRNLKSRNNINAKKDAEILLKELRDEYLSSPNYKKFEPEIADILVALDQIK